ncbi:MAG TPA: preprotein translocase subunit SecG [Patescibacteria group bacterium]|nr:preprotein translocase subunit SecG [Patescibacteria group bacterium]
MSFELGLKIMLALYVIVALAMIGLILLQRGSGAQAGSGFGGGASATVFGSRGSANFLSNSTKWLAVLFFALSIGMGVYISHNSKAPGTTTDLGVMAGAEVPVEGAAIAPAPNGDVPAAPVQTSEVPEATDANASAPAAATEVEAPKDGKTKDSTQPETSN